MPDQYDPVDQKWASQTGDPGWHWPWTFLLTAFGIAGAVVVLIAIVTGIL